MVKEPNGVSRAKVTKINGLVDFGLLLALIFFGFFGGWAISVPLSSAIIASGKVIKQGRTLEVSHELGGVVSAIKVREGQMVKKGDVLVVLDDVERRSLRNRQGAKLQGLLLMQARLLAEQNGQEQFAFEGPIADLSDVEFAALLADQKAQFATRRAARESERGILVSQKRAMQEELTGVDGEAKSLRVQIASLRKETSLRREISKQGYGRASELRRFERELAAAEGEMARLKTRQHALPFKITELAKRLEVIDGEFFKEVSSELAEVRRQIVDTENQFAAAQNAFRRVEVTAPSDGVVGELHVNTIGSAVAAFAPIAEIVPENAQVVVEVEVNPADIDEIQVNQTARIVLSAFDQNEVQPVDGITIFVSPDQRIRERDGSPYFVARLTLDPEQATGLPTIQSGMPVEAYLTTGERTFAEILFEPLTRSVQRSFRG